jgi:hypothetical protein
MRGARLWWRTPFRQVGGGIGQWFRWPGMRHRGRDDLVTSEPSVDLGKHRSEYVAIAVCQEHHEVRSMRTRIAFDQVTGGPFSRNGLRLSQIAKLTRAWYNQGVSRVRTQARNRLNR